MVDESVTRAEQRSCSSWFALYWGGGGLYFSEQAKKFIAMGHVEICRSSYCNVRAFLRFIRTATHITAALNIFDTKMNCYFISLQRRANVW